MTQPLSSTSPRFRADGAAPSGAAGHADNLARALAARSAHVGVIGLGYVGAPLALAFWKAGFRVTGFDISQARVAAIRRGERVINYLGAQEIAEAAASERFRATDDFKKLSDLDAIVICVPTPLTRHNEPDLSYIRTTIGAILKELRPGVLVVLESTTWPGTTREVVEPILATSGLKRGEDYFLAFSPEREDPGNEQFRTRSIPKVVGADDPTSLRLAIALYGAAVERVVPVSSAAAAEAVKLTENIFRSVNIALANELKEIYGALGIDVWEVIDAAATKPFGYMPFYPGPGLGGHCIPIDPFYLTWKAREAGVETRFIELAGVINTRMPKIVVDRIDRAMQQRRPAGIVGAQVLIAGLAYKKNINDIRESPALVIMELIEERGGRCDFADPLAPVIPNTREHASLAGRASVELTADNLRRYDAVALITDHDAFDYQAIAEHASLVIDTRNAFDRRGVKGKHILKA